jgi:hypothetical protein
MELGPSDWTRSAFICSNWLDVTFPSDVVRLLPVHWSAGEEILSNLRMIESRDNPSGMLIVGLVGKIVFNKFFSQRVLLQAVESFFV